MSPFDLNQVSNTISIGEGDQDQTVRPFFAVANDSSFSCPVFFRNPHDRGADARGYLLPQQLLQQGQDPKDHPVMGNESSGHWGDQDTNNKIKLTWCKKFAEEQEHEGAGQYWMSSKMRIMKKMMSSEESKPTELNTHVTDEQNHFSSSIKPPNGVIRVCSDCNTTKTPLWRGGPRGPKSLCNACGIRQRKARRAMEATAAMSGAIHSDAPTKIRKEKKPDNKHQTAAAPFKKRCKITTASSAPRKHLGFEDCKIGLSTTNSAFHEVFPQDERDAAILLMALSCGLIRS